MITGSAGNDELSGFGGIDTIDGGEGNDRLDGGSGVDTLDSGEGNDVLRGGGTNATRKGTMKRAIR
ncbi:MAG: hypothetical protein NZP72_04860 [Geminicoccaceae bacterium]|nr:hypothetical protein [Geminicoccaceae bacterium]